MTPRPRALRCAGSRLRGLRAPRPRPRRRPLRVVALQNAGFELDAPRRCRSARRAGNCTAHADPTSFVLHVDPAQPAAGTRSLRIERVRQRAVGA